MTIAIDATLLMLTILLPITAPEFLIIVPITILMLLVPLSAPLARMAFMPLPMALNASHVLTSVLDADCKPEYTNVLHVLLEHM
jgi:hypothetical protein